MNGKNLIMAAMILWLCIACDKGREMTLSGLNIRDFQTEIDGQLTNLFVLKNKNGMEACITNYGGRLVSLMVPDRNGKLEDIVCGYPTIADYLAKKQNFGATIGRYIGRIHNSTFTLDSITYRLTPNTGPHCAHGGPQGFASKIWQAEQLDINALKLTLLSPDGECGFPGQVEVHMVYRLTDDNALDIHYEAETDKPTVLNLSHHSFFNLSADFTTSVEDQLLFINADAYTPYDSLKCVTGEILPVAGTPFDFTTPHLIGERIDTDIMQLKAMKGYDHNWVLNTEGDDTKLAARLTDPKSGRSLEVYTDEPGLQVYTANGLRGAMVGKRGIAYPKRSAVCLETQHFADSPNQPQFPSTVLRPGEKYTSHCVYRFGTVASE